MAAEPPRPDAEKLADRPCEEIMAEVKEISDRLDCENYFANRPGGSTGCI